MDQIKNEKKMDYLNHLVTHLDQNNERIQLEKNTLNKMEKSFNQLKPHFKETLEQQLKNIKTQVERQEKIYKEAQENVQKKEDKMIPFLADCRALEVLLTTQATISGPHQSCSRCQQEYFLQFLEEYLLLLVFCFLLTTLSASLRTRHHR